jgi:hypothetical protein
MPTTEEPLDESFGNEESQPAKRELPSWVVTVIAILAAVGALTALFAPLFLRVDGN